MGVLIILHVHIEHVVLFLMSYVVTSLCALLLHFFFTLNNAGHDRVVGNMTTRKSTWFGLHESTFSGKIRSRILNRDWEEKPKGVTQLRRRSGVFV